MRKHSATEIIPGLKGKYIEAARSFSPMFNVAVRELRIQDFKLQTANRNTSLDRFSADIHKQLGIHVVL